MTNSVFDNKRVRKKKRKENAHAMFLVTIFNKLFYIIQ